MSVVSHQLDIYGTWLHLALTIREWASLRKRIPKLPSIEDGTIGFTSREVTDDGAVHLAIYLNADVLTGQPRGLVEILTHEATHAGAMLLDHIGQDYDGESEALAYLVAFIAAWAWGHFPDPEPAT